MTTDGIEESQGQSPEWVSGSRGRFYKVAVGTGT